LRSDKLNWRINHQITAPKVRVIGDDGKQLGVITIEQALAESIKAGLDLVEIAPKANPPVAKIVNLGKFRYQEEKKLQKQKRKNKSAEIKEVRLSPFIADNDFSNRLTRIKEFLGEGNKVRVVVKFKGRQLGSKNFGYDVMKKILSELGENIAIDMEPKFIGRHLTMVVSPVSKTKIKKVTELEDSDKSKGEKNTKN